MPDVFILRDVTAVPESIARWQFAQAVADKGTISQDEATNWAARGELPDRLEAAIPQLPAAMQGRARLLLSATATFRRSHELTPTIGALLGFDGPALDEIWRAGALLA